MRVDEFLLARIAEDEAVARSCRTGRWDELSFYDQAADDTPHITRHSPARVLAECAARRFIIEVEHSLREVASLDRETRGQAFLVCRRCRIGERQVIYPCPTVRMLALPYADHPDYDEAWTVPE